MPPRAAGTSDATRRGVRGLTAVGGSVLLIAVTGLAGPNAATPPVGGDRLLPPWSLETTPPSWLVAAVLAGALLLGAWGSLTCWRALREGWKPSVRRLLALSVLAAGVLVLVPPMGSADHLSYAAYGRIAALGADPYVIAPDEFRGDNDPVVSGVRAPWRSTVSVYGPVATGAHALAARLGGDDLHSVVLLLALTTAGAFVLTGVLLAAAARRPEAVLLWGLNPLLLWTLVAGAHADALAVLPAVAALVVQRVRGVGPAAPLLAGLLAGVAAGVKLPYGVVLLAVVWVVRASLPRVAAALLGCAAALAAAYASVGAHSLDQTREAARMVASASAWAPVAHGLDKVLGKESARDLVGLVMAVVAVAVAVALGRWLRWERLSLQESGAAVWAVLGIAYVLAGMYVLPWYDAIAWAPLCLLVRSGIAEHGRLTALLGVHSLVLALAYVPGRVEGLAPWVEDVTLGFRVAAAPAVSAILLLLVLRSLRRSPEAAARWWPSAGRA